MRMKTLIIVNTQLSKFGLYFAIHDLFKTFNLLKNKLKVDCMNNIVYFRALMTLAS